MLETGLPGGDDATPAAAAAPAGDDDSEERVAVVAAIRAAGWLIAWLLLLCAEGDAGGVLGWSGLQVTSGKGGMPSAIASLRLRTALLLLIADVIFRCFCSSSVQCGPSSRRVRCGIVRDSCDTTAQAHTEQEKLVIARRAALCCAAVAALLRPVARCHTCCCCSGMLLSRLGLVA